MTLMAWLWIGLSILGAIVLAAVVWLAGPLISIGDVQPFDSGIVRLLIILLIVLAVGGAIATKFFPKADPASIVAALKAMDAGVAEAGKLDADNMQNLLTLSKEMNGESGKEITAKAADGDLWSNGFVEKALAK